MKRTVATATEVPAKRAKKSQHPPALPAGFLTAHPAVFNTGLLHIIALDPILEPIISSSQFHQFPQRVVEDTPSPPSSGSVSSGVSSSGSVSHYKHLTKAIISQQIHPKAANAIEGRLTDHYGHYPSAQELSSTDDSLLRSLGLSARKTAYLRSVSEHFLEKDLGVFLEQQQGKTNEEIVERLVEIKGIGEWSAKMFLIFSLQRLDVFAEGDLGIKRGFSYFMETRKHLLEGIEEPIFVKSAKKRSWKTYSDHVMLGVAEKYAPYRSVLMLILWRMAALDTSSLS